MTRSTQSRQRPTKDAKTRLQRMQAIVMSAKDGMSDDPATGMFAYDVGNSLGSELLPACDIRKSLSPDEYTNALVGAWARYVIGRSYTTLADDDIDRCVRCCLDACAGYRLRLRDDDAAREQMRLLSDCINATTVRSYDVTARLSSMGISLPPATDATPDGVLADVARADAIVSAHPHIDGAPAWQEFTVVSNSNGRKLRLDSVMYDGDTDGWVGMRHAKSDPVMDDVEGMSDLTLHRIAKAVDLSDVHADTAGDATGDTQGDDKSSQGIIARVIDVVRRNGGEATIADANGTRHTINGVMYAPDGNWYGCNGEWAGKGGRDVYSSYDEDRVPVMTLERIIS